MIFNIALFIWSVIVIVYIVYGIKIRNERKVPLPLWMDIILFILVIIFAPIIFINDIYQTIQIRRRIGKWVFIWKQ